MEIDNSNAKDGILWNKNSSARRKHVVLVTDFNDGSESENDKSDHEKEREAGTIEIPSQLNKLWNTIPRYVLNMRRKVRE
jgi:hypothetical protein